MEKIKLNIGCGPNGQIDGFINIDNSKAVLLGKFHRLKRFLHRIGLLSDEKFKANWKDVVWMDASRKLRFRDGSVEKIYSSHFLEHIPRDKGASVLRECYRTLRPGGVMRLVLPDLLWHAEKYVAETNGLIEAGTESFTSKVHDKLLNTIYGAYLEPVRYGLLHCYMYDFPTIHCLLGSTGFRDICQFEYKEGGDDELSKYDCRPEDSMHIECRK